MRQPSKISSLPDLEVGEKSSEFLHIIHAAAKMAFHYKTIKVTPVLAKNWEINKRYMAEILFKVKHWRIISGDYTLASDIEATWFIDPPYKEDPGKGYNMVANSLITKNWPIGQRIGREKLYFAKGIAVIIYHSSHYYI